MSPMNSILLVEDDPFLVDIYSTELKNSGFSVGIALDGFDALRKIRDKRFDLVLLDIVIPHVDGWKVLKKIKEDKSLKTKVVILSNLGEKEDVEKSLKLGAENYLIKTHYTPKEVIEEIKKTLKI